MTDSHDHMVADARPDNWVDRLAPHFIRPYLRLARLDRPIGTWLLLWPCLWSLSLGATADERLWPDLWLMALFAIGALAMRGAGCTYNDIIDRDIDAKVERTRSRPIPSGQVSTKAAAVFLVAHCLVGLWVLLSLNMLSIFLGVASLGLVAAYPFMKRITYWPQAWLGLTFNWGALMGYAAATGTLTLAPVFLYLGAILWTVGYDTVYAHQDKEDDALIGVKSTALKLGGKTGPWLTVFYTLSLGFFALAGAAGGLSIWFFAGLAGLAAHFVWQVRSLALDDPAHCLAVFKSNREAGALLFLAFLVGRIG